MSVKNIIDRCNSKVMDWHSRLEMSNGKKASLLEKQRHAVFIYSCMVVILGITINLLEIGGPHTIFYKTANSIHLSITIVILLLYLRNRLTAINAFFFLCLVTQMEISVEMIYCAGEGSAYSINLIIGNTVLTAVVMMLSVVAHIRFLPYIVSLLFILSYGYCLWITGNKSLENMFPIILLAFFILSLLGQRLIKNIANLEKEKDQLKEDEQQVLNLFELNKAQLMAYIALAKKKGLSPEQTGMMLDGVGSRAKENIRDNVIRYIRQSEIDYENLEAKLPGLTPSEIQICDLILKDRKLKDICEILKKTESNITCQRSNIRAKLGLQKGDDLREELRKRTKGATTDYVQK